MVRASYERSNIKLLNWKIWTKRDLQTIKNS
nr:unnamed protein product [Callosobruchus chinensis]